MKGFSHTEVQRQKSNVLELTRARLILFILISVMVGGLIGWVIVRNIPSRHPAAVAQVKEIRAGGYTFTKPLLIANESNIQSKALNPLKHKIQQETYDILNDPQVQIVSIYFRDLKYARWIGIEENEIYNSASLLKVPLLISFLRQVESDPFLFSKKILYPGEPQDNKNIEFYTLKPGTEYTIGELLNAMIVKSDNSAKDLLFQFLDTDFRNKVFQELGLTIPNQNEQYQISPRTYSLFFRILYNATYLTRDDSEKALELLSKSEYQEGLVAGVPSTIPIAHKFGQYEFPIGNAYASGLRVWELHDCGIVYHPSNPYLLCVMTRGEDLEKLSRLIKTISKITYQEANNNFQ